MARPLRRQPRFRATGDGIGCYVVVYRGCLPHVVVIAIWCRGDQSVFKLVAWHRPSTVLCCEASDHWFLHSVASDAPAVSGVWRAACLPHVGSVIAVIFGVDLAPTRLAPSAPDSVCIEV